MGVVGSVIGIIFGVFWTALAFAMTRDAPFPMVGVIFPLFGVLFIIMGVASLIYNLNNTVNPNRLSTFDITSDAEEHDPLNQRFGAPRGSISRKPSTSSDENIRKHPGAFCPFCGGAVEPQFDYCPKCGKNI